MKISKFIFAMALCAFAGTAFAQVKVTELTNKAQETTLKEKAKRVHSYTIKAVPGELRGLQAVYMPRGSSQKPGVSYSFKVDVPVTVYLFVDARFPKLKFKGWKKTALKASWLASKKTYGDNIYTKDFPAGVIKIAANPKSCIPHMAVLKKK
jgi:hypothetical protein